MSRLFDQPRRVYAILVVAAIVCFLLGGADGGDPADGSERAHDAGYLVAGIGWTLFMLIVLCLAAYTVALVARHLRPRSAA